MVAVPFFFHFVSESPETHMTNDIILRLFNALVSYLNNSFALTARQWPFSLFMLNSKPARVYNT